MISEMKQEEGWEKLTNLDGVGAEEVTFDLG